MNHLPQCRRNLEYMMPNYGSDCTCGLEYLVEYVREKFFDGPIAVAEYLNETISWTAKRREE